MNSFIHVSGMFLGTGLQIPAAAKHALQMSGSVAFGNLANGVSLSHFRIPVFESIELNGI